MNIFQSMNNNQFICIALLHYSLILLFKVKWDPHYFYRTNNSTVQTESSKIVSFFLVGCVKTSLFSLPIPFRALYLLIINLLKSRKNISLAHWINNEIITLFQLRVSICYTKMILYRGVTPKLDSNMQYRMVSVNKDNQINYHFQDDKLLNGLRLLLTPINNSWDGYPLAHEIFLHCFDVLFYISYARIFLLWRYLKTCTERYNWSMRLS